jgi:hypothetical protein
VSFGVSRSFGADRNSCHFLWYGGVAGEGLRSVGAAPSKSVCSILPLARHLRAGESSVAQQPRPAARRYCPWPRFLDPSLARPSLCVLSALRGISDDETMTTPGAAGTTPRPGVLQSYPCSAHRFLSWGRRSHATGLRSFALPRSQAAGCFLCTGWRGVHKKTNTHQSTSEPLPCTIEAITRSGTDILSSRPTGPFFTQRRGRRILGSSR